MFESNLLSQVNVASPLPTFVETHLISILNKTMHQAFLFAHAMLADRVESFGALLPYSSEVFYSLWGLLEWKSLQNTDATFSENLFGLKRCLLASPHTMLADHNLARASSLTFRPLTRHSRFASWVSVVLFPYVSRWLKLRYDRLTAGTPDADLERQAVERRYGAIVKLLHEALIRLFPLWHLITEGSTYAYTLAFLLERTPYLSLWQQLFHIVVKRLSVRDRVSAQSKPGAARVLLATQLILVVTMLGFRLLEWRGADGVGGGGAAAAVDDADQAGAPQVRMPLLSDDPAAHPREGASADEAVAPGVCPVCKRKVTNPSVNTATGVIGCYPCMQTYVNEHNECPATKKLSVEQNIRRLYEV